jgi:hypothetical protein
VRPAAHRQVDQQRQGFAQVQLDRRSVALQPWLAKDHQLQVCHRDFSRSQGDHTGGFWITQPT